MRSGVGIIKLSLPDGALSCLPGLVDFLLHLDHHLGEHRRQQTVPMPWTPRALLTLCCSASGQIIARNGNATYAILFGIVFAETGFVLTPFLPGEVALAQCSF